MRTEGNGVGSRQSAKLVEILARQTSQPLDEARRVYELQFLELEKIARVRTYLHILAAKQARDILLDH